MNCNLKEVNLSQTEFKEDLIKRGEIMNDLEEEMRKLRSKYFLGYKKEDLVSEIQSEGNNHRDRDISSIANEAKKKEEIEGKEGIIKSKESERRTPDENNNIDNTNKDFGIRIEKNSECNNNQPSLDNFRLSFNFDNRENHQVKHTNRQEFKLDAFDKAKEKLLQIKNELDDMDRYDFRSSRFAQSKRECEMYKISFK